MMKYAVAAAASLSLLACAQTPANKSGNTASTSATAAAASASWGQAKEPPPAYKAYFDLRWPQGGASVTPAEVEAMLRTQTPQQVFDALDGSGENSRWDTVMRGIAKGDPAWLELAVRLRPGTAADTAEDFAIAAADALTTNARGALRLLWHMPAGGGGCTTKGVEASPGHARAFYETAIVAVEPVNDTELQMLKSTCITNLRIGLAQFLGAHRGLREPR